jgi:acyl-CoA dehydrogenase family protein 9
MEPLSEKLKEFAAINLSDPIGSVGLVLDYVSERIMREVRPERITRAHPELEALTNSVSDQVRQLREISESTLRKHKKGVVERQYEQKRLADSVADIYAQIAVLSRVTSIFEDQGVEPSGQERYIAQTFCTRAAGRVRSRFTQIEHNDDERMTAIAKLAYKRGAYGYSFYED